MTRAVSDWSRRRQAAAGPAPGEARYSAFLYIAPGLLLYGAFVLLPLAQAIRLSFFSWDGISPRHWVGLANYGTILHDGQLRSSFLHALLLIAFYSFFPVVVGFLLASIIVRARVRGQTFFRAVLFLPQVIPTVAVAIAWRWIYADDGPLNNTLSTLGMGGATHSWLGDFTWALPALGVVGAWANYGLVMVLFVAGIQKIPPSLFEAAQVDGAGPLREFFAVTLPNLRGELAVALVLTSVTALRSFDLVFVATSGGPGTSTTVPGLELFQTAFTYGQLGLASAIGVALALVIFAVVLVIRRVEGAVA